MSEADTTPEPPAPQKRPTVGRARMYAKSTPDGSLQAHVVAREEATPAPEAPAAELQREPAPRPPRFREPARAVARSRPLMRYPIPDFVSEEERKAGVSIRRLPRFRLQRTQRLSVLLTNPDGPGYTSLPLIGYAEFDGIGSLPLVEHEGEPRVATTIEALTGFVHNTSRSWRHRRRTG